MNSQGEIKFCVELTAGIEHAWTEKCEVKKFVALEMRPYSDEIRDKRYLRWQNKNTRVTNVPDFDIDDFRDHQTVVTTK